MEEGLDSDEEREIQRQEEEEEDAAHEPEYGAQDVGKLPSSPNRPQKDTTLTMSRVCTRSTYDGSDTRCQLASTCIDVAHASSQFCIITSLLLRPDISLCNSDPGLARSDQTMYAFM